MNKTSVKPTRVGSEIPMFLLKLVSLLQAEDFQKYVAWNENGTSFTIKDSENFCKLVLPKYFKHNKIQSFIRQLNLYGFRKVTSIYHGLQKQEDTEEFRHPFFLKDRPDLLPLIKRKVNPSTKLNEEIAQVLDEVNEIKDTQMEITNSLIDIKRENDDLWREVVSLRQKHTQQQKVVNHLVKFLVSLVQHHGMGRKRHLPIEWKGSSSSESEPPNKLINKPSGDSRSTALFDDVINTNSSSPDGPLITELLSSPSEPSSVFSPSIIPSSFTGKSDDDSLDLSELINDLNNSGNAAQSSHDALVPFSPGLDLASSQNSDYISSLLSSSSPDSGEINSALTSNIITPTSPETSNLPIATISNNVSLPITSEPGEIEPSLFLNIPKKSNPLSVLDKSPLNQTSVSSSPNSSLSKTIKLIPTPIFKKKVKVQKNLDSNMRKIEDNLQNIQTRLSRNDQYLLDDNTLEDLFNGKILLPPPHNDSDPSADLTETDNNELVPYTGITGNPILDLTTDGNDQAEFDEFSNLLS